MSKQPLILMVDDDPQFLELYEVKLKKVGFSILKAYDGKEGYDIAKKKKPDLILLDLKMPIIDGVEFLTKLRKETLTKNIKVVIFSAFNEYSPVKLNSQTAKAIGTIDFVDKRIDLNEFVVYLRKLLNYYPDTTE